MDNTKESITHLSLCSGYGGIDIGLKTAFPNLRTIAYCERETFPVANLVKKMEEGRLCAAPIWTDIATFPWKEFHGLVDILSGGYPCQPFSFAGDRKGKDDNRHLWPYIARGIEALRPRACLFENVEGHVSMGLSTVISDLEELGYDATWGLFSAEEVGAPHPRLRVFIMAYSRDHRQQAKHWWSQLEKEYSADRDAIGYEPGVDFPARKGESQYIWEPEYLV